MAERLILGNVRLTIIDRVMTKEPLQGELKLKAYAIAPFRSHWVAFDMLFRANGDGELEGKEFSVHERPIQAGHGTHWQAKNLPVQWFGNAIGSPFSWFQSGEFDLEIEDSWSLAREQEVRSKWDLQFRDLKSAVPDDLPLKQKMLAVPIVAFLNRAPNPLPISFEITFDGNAFKGKASPEAVGLWQIIHDAANKALNAGRDPPQ
ncbi:MAG: hypothetical protein IAG10_31240 [Planctomycetaceae bacterium]|nr:hypothetical protein [Planctomycetaceae bacterium]